MSKWKIAVRVLHISLMCLVVWSVLGATSTVNAANVTLRLYVQDENPSQTGLPIQGARVTVQDSTGNYFFNDTTNANGYVTIIGSAGTWYFTAARDGYQSATPWHETYASGASPTRRAFLISVSSPPKFLTFPFVDTAVQLWAGWKYSDNSAHEGIDFVKVGTAGDWKTFNVVAADDGWATYQGYTPETRDPVTGKITNYQYGHHVLVRHDENDSSGNHYFTLYAHLATWDTNIPDSPAEIHVERGQFLGTAGQTGAPDVGKHLHFEVDRATSTPRYRVDPYGLYSTNNNNEYLVSGSRSLWTTNPPSYPNSQPPSLLPAPILSAPYPNGAADVSTTPTFTWSQVPGANKYWITAANSRSLLPTIPSQTTAPGCLIDTITSSTSYPRSTALPSGTTIYWEVQAFNDTVTPIRQGQYSEQWSFTTQASSSLLPPPILSAPYPNGAADVSTTPTFTWSQVPGANKYWITAANSRSLLPTIPSQTTAPGCLIDTITSSTSYPRSTALPSGTTIYWEVQAFNDTVTPIRQGQYSEQWSFTTQASSSLLPPPILSAPYPNGVADVSTTPTFTWSQVPGANKYWITAANSRSLLPTIPSQTTAPGCLIDTITSSTSYPRSTALPSGTTIYWEVQAFNDTVTPIRQGQYSEQWSFTTESVSPPTTSYDRDAAFNYASNYSNKVCSDGYFWTWPSTVASYIAGTSVPTGTGVDGGVGDDCAHFVSCCIGNEPHIKGGGIDVPSRTVSYGEPGAARLGNWLISSGIAEEKTSVNDLETGDVINYDSHGDKSWEHVAIYIGGGKVAAHSASTWNSNWQLTGFNNWRFIHIRTNTDSTQSPYSANFDIRDLEGFNNSVITGNDIELFIRAKTPNSPLLGETNIGSSFIDVGMNNNVNPAFLVATADLEGRFGTLGWTAAHPECHNTMGWGIPSGSTAPNGTNCATTWREMLNRVADGIAHGPYYYSNGKYTVDQVRGTYAGEPNSQSIADIMNDLYNIGSGTTGQKLLGAVDGAAASQGIGYFILDKWMASTTGSLNRISIKCSGTGVVQVAVYSDIYGNPYECLAYSSGTAVHEGWNMIDLNEAVLVFKDQPYWLGFVEDAPVVYYQCGSGRQRRAMQRTTSSASFPFPELASSVPTANYGSWYNLLAGYSDPSYTPPAPPSPPSPPTNLTATPVSSSQINLSWNDTAGETGYRIYRKTGSGGTYAPIGTANANVTSYNDSSGLSPSTSYCYQVKAYNAGGDSNPSNEYCQTTSAVQQATITVAYPNGGENLQVGSTYTITWSYSGVAGNVNISLSTDGGSSWPISIATNTANDGSHSWVVPNQLTPQARIKVTSVSDGNVSDISNSNFTITAAAPTSQKLMGANDGAVGASGSGYLIMDGWTVSNAGNLNQIQVNCAGTGNVKVAVYANNNGSPGARLAYSESTSVSQPGWKSINLNTAIAVSQGEVYWLAFKEDSSIVYYQNSSGRQRLAAQAAYSDSFPVTAGMPTANYGSWYNLLAGYSDPSYTPPAPPSPPSPPTNLTATPVSSSQINLSWNDTAGETGYRIYRKTGSGGTYAPIGTANANATSYNDTSGLLPSTSYCYQVKAYNAGGDSNPSNEYCQTTSAVQQATITVAYPNGGENLQVGSTYTITWSYSGVAGNVNISLSTDGGSSWPISIATNTANDGSHSWVVPNQLTPQARIKVTSVSDGNVSDISNSNFTITAAAPTSQKLMGANEGAVGASGSGYLIMDGWTVSNAGNLNQIQVNCAGTGNVKVAVYANNNGSPGARLAYSESTSVSQPGWKSINLNTAIAVSQGEVYWLAFKEDGSIVYYQNSSGRQRLAAQAAYSDSFPVTAGMPTANYGSWYNLLAGYSDPSYTPPAPPSPPSPPTNLTATPVSSSQINLSWNDTAGETGYRIYRKTGSGGTYAPIGTANANATSYNDTSGLLPSTSYCYQVKAYNAGGDSNPSNEYCQTTSAVQQATITVAYPNGGENLQVGSTYTITWSYSGVSGNVNISLSTDGGSSWPISIVTNTANDGSHSWVVPNQLTPQARIKITSVSDGNVSDMSNSNFTITAAAPTSQKLMGANDGAVGASGSGYLIMDGWTVSNAGNLNQIQVNCAGTGNVKVAVYANNNGSPGARLAYSESTYVSQPGWKSINLNTAITVSQGEVYWLAFKEDGSIVYYQNSSGRQRLAAQAAYSDSFPVTAGMPTANYGSWYNLLAGYSDPSYTPPAPPQATITVAYPNGGENLQVGSTYTITWSYSGVSGNVNISLSTDGGNSWPISIVTNTANSGSYSWVVPNQLTTQARIKITSVADGNVSDMSNSNFTIHEPNVDFLWSFKRDLPDPRVLSATAVVNSKVYVLGGNMRLSNLVYDPTNDSWNSKASLPGEGSDEGGAAAILNKIYVVSGGPFDYNVKIYNVDSDSWTTGATMPTARRGIGVAAVNGKIYAIGGMDDSLNEFATVEEYNPSTNIWIGKTNMSSPRGFASVAVVDNLIYVIGGRGLNSIYRTVEVYNPSTDTWSSRTSMPTARNSAAIGVINGKIYVVGGFSGSTALGTVEEYNPITNTWRTLNPSSFQRSGAMAGVVSNKLYVIGGTNKDGANLRTVEEGVVN